MQTMDLNGIPLGRTVFTLDLATGRKLVNECPKIKPNCNYKGSTANSHCICLPYQWTLVYHELNIKLE
jgi:hypothetical protein